MPQLKNGLFTLDRRLDRIPHVDPRSAQYPIRRLISDIRPLRSYTWACNYYLDQGEEGACVEFGICHELLARPVSVSIRAVQNIVDSHGIYWTAQQNDPWEGGDYPGANPIYSGTSLTAGMEVARELGFYPNYLWAQSERDIALAVGYRGPVIIGVNWYEGMFDTDADGFINVTGELLGGHCTLLRGIRLVGDYYIVHNSWGKGWGIDGLAKLRRSDMARLLAENGEACLPVRSAKLI